MSLQRAALTVLVTSVLVVAGVVAYATSKQFVASIEEAETSQYDLMKKIIEFNIQGLESRALARAELVASLPSVREKFAAGDREGLTAELKTMFEVQRDKFGVDQAQFHVPPATSFLRLNNPKQFGDDLSSFRPIVVAVNGDFVARKGMSISRSGPGVFGVAPVLSPSGKPVGTFEIGGAFGPVLDGIKRAYGLETAMFIDEARLKNAAPDLGGDVYSEKNRMGRFIKFASTNWELLRNLVTDAELSAPSIEDNPYTREAHETPYGVAFAPLRNPAGELIGMIVVAKDFSPTRATLGQSMIWIAVYAVFGAILLAGLVIILVRGAVGRPLATLNARFAALSRGETAEPLAGAESYYGEISELAEHYEALRTQQAAASRDGAA